MRKALRLHEYHNSTKLPAKLKATSHVGQPERLQFQAGHKQIAYCSRPAIMIVLISCKTIKYGLEGAAKVRAASTTAVLPTPEHQR